MKTPSIPHPVLFLALSTACLTAGYARAQSCAEPPASAFVIDTLVAATASNTLNSGENVSDTHSGSMGVQMAIAPDGRVFIAKMKTGQIRVYVPGTPNTTALAGTEPTYFSNEDGLLGIAIPPDFATTNWLYTYASDPCGLSCADRSVVLARYTVVNNQLTNRKVILRVPRSSDNHHAGGGLAFDARGVLLIGNGDNMDPHNTNNNGYGPIYYPTAIADAQRSASNTNDLRGKILRIKPIAFPDDQTPTPGLDQTYSVPSGNLWERITDVSFNPRWRNDSDDVSKVRKEVYVFGTRNPYRPRVDSRSGWVFWGDVGPDAATTSATRGPAGHDEFNLTARPGFFGHPYCNGYNVPYGSLTSPSTTYGNLYDCATGNGSSTLTPLNNMSPGNTGLVRLPPAIPALVAYSSGNSTDDDPRFSPTYSLTTVAHDYETAISGPMYRYDSTAAAGRFPPYYEGKIFFFDWSRRFVRVITMNPDGTIPAGAAGVTDWMPNGWLVASYIDMAFGPDGALYALRHADNGYKQTNTLGSGLYRVRYTGAYDNSCFSRFKPTVWGPGATDNPASIRGVVRKTVSPGLSANGTVVVPAGFRTVTLYDLSGRKVWSKTRTEADQTEDVRLPGTLAEGVLQARFTP